MPLHSKRAVALFGRGTCCGMVLPASDTGQCSTLDKTRENAAAVLPAKEQFTWPSMRACTVELHVGHACTYRSRHHSCFLMTAFHFLVPTGPEGQHRAAQGGGSKDCTAGGSQACCCGKGGLRCSQAHQGAVLHLVWSHAGQCTLCMQAGFCMVCSQGLMKMAVGVGCHAVCLPPHGGGPRMNAVRASHEFMKCTWLSLHMCTHAASYRPYAGGH